MNFKLHVWRQRDAQDKGRMVAYTVQGIGGDTSFLEMLDLLNEELTEKRRRANCF